VCRVGGMRTVQEPAVDLVNLRAVIDGPLHAIASRFSRLLSERWPHDALVIFTRECTGRPRKVAGDSDLTNKITIDELDALKKTLEDTCAVSTHTWVAGASRKVWAVRDQGGTLLVLIPRNPGIPVPHPDMLSAVFGIVATSIRQQVSQASPDYLAESRAVSAERARTISEMAAAHETSLVAVLGTLRAADLDDTRARLAAADAASSALVALRSAQKSDRELSEEAAHRAFEQLRKDIRHMLRHHEACIEFAPPPKTGQPLPGEIAYAARAMTRAAVLAFLAQPQLTRLRIGWSSLDASLIVDVRDQGNGELDLPALRRQLQGRAQTLGGSITLDAIPGWGSHARLVLPLDPPADRPEQSRLADLNPRELEVLRLVAQGQRNKAIGDAIGITESTVKFHVADVLRKLEVALHKLSAGPAMALRREQGRCAGCRPRWGSRERLRPIYA